MNQIVIGSDHAGYELKEFLKNQLKDHFQITDTGTNNDESSDYPEYAHKLSVAVLGSDNISGILICGSGNGVCITANKHHGIRAALCWNVEIAVLARQHNDANVICLPARFISKEIALEMVLAFLKTPFEGGRHQRRVDKINL